MDASRVKRKHVAMREIAVSSGSMTISSGPPDRTYVVNPKPICEFLPKRVAINWQGGKPVLTTAQMTTMRFFPRAYCRREIWKTAAVFHSRNGVGGYPELGFALDKPLFPLQTHDLARL
ncbi:MAG: hypothetical protein KGI75_10225 [Rhizobiaceae bacterium]|nr:hypothetical protein [Rhizobiaceae bacterium]